MIERGDGARLLLETCGVFKRFDGDDPVEPRVPGAPDFTHPAGADQREDLVGTEGGSGSERHVLTIVSWRGDVFESRTTACASR